MDMVCILDTSSPSAKSITHVSMKMHNIAREKDSAYQELLSCQLSVDMPCSGK